MLWSPWAYIDICLARERKRHASLQVPEKREDAPKQVQGEKTTADAPQVLPEKTTDAPKQAEKTTDAPLQVLAEKATDAPLQVQGEKTTDAPLQVHGEKTTDAPLQVHGEKTTDAPQKGEKTTTDAPLQVLAEKTTVAPQVLAEKTTDAPAPMDVDSEGAEQLHVVLRRPNTCDLEQGAIPTGNEPMQPLFAEVSGKVVPVPPGLSAPQAIALGLKLVSKPEPAAAAAPMEVDSKTKKDVPPVPVFTEVVKKEPAEEPSNRKRIAEEPPNDVPRGPSSSAAPAPKPKPAADLSEEESKKAQNPKQLARELSHMPGRPNAVNYKPLQAASKKRRRALYMKFFRSVRRP